MTLKMICSINCGHGGQTDRSVVPCILLSSLLVDGHHTGQPPLIWALLGEPGLMINGGEWLAELFHAPSVLSGESQQVPQTCEYLSGAAGHYLLPPGLQDIYSAAHSCLPTQGLVALRIILLNVKD